MLSVAASLLAITASAGLSSASPLPGDSSTLQTRGQNCDPVGCYPDTSFSILGDFDGNDQIVTHMYYRGQKSDFTWQCNLSNPSGTGNFYSFNSNLPYVFEIDETSGLYCDDRYDQTFIRYGAITGPMSDNPNCAQTNEYSYRCILRADGSNGSGLD